jgi:SHS2 domain-containing protein
MPPYEILEHTADVGIKAHGRSLPELFVNAALGLVAVALEPEEISTKEVLPLFVTGADREDLLVNWLSEILYRMDAEGWTFGEFRIHRLQETTLEAEGCGERRHPADRSRRVAVKAITYHQLAIRETEQGWEAVVFFDI